MFSDQLRGAVIPQHGVRVQALAVTLSAGEPPSLTERIRGAGLDLGFVRVGFARAERYLEAAEAFSRWIAAGHHGAMGYLSSSDDRADPAAVMPGARSVIVGALPYERVVPLGRKHGDLAGRVAAYAQGRDYHLVLRDRLRALADACERLAGAPVQSRVCVDTAPVLERESARRAGVGFTGKSAMTIAPGVGTRFALGVLLVDLTLDADTPGSPGCGRCTECMDRCPTKAFVAPYVVDARRCIAYLTIENEGPIPRDLRAAVGDRIFGCDECQDVCPYNASANRGTADALDQGIARPTADLVSWLSLGAAGYRKLVRRRALRRAHRPQLARNAAVALGNSGDPRAVPPLARSLLEDKHPLVRSHAAWALGRLGGAEARAALQRAAVGDTDPGVREEAEAALSELGSA